MTIALSEGAPPTFIARVRADVAYLIVTLTNGQRLTLRPVAIFGPGYARYVAFPVPASSAVVMITAFSARAEVGYAIPFTGAGGLDTVLWRRPGEQPPSKRASYLIGSGTLNGRPWSEHAYQGPWGFCAVTPLSATWCIPDTPGNLTAGKAATLLFQSWAGDTGYVTVAATPAVSYLVLSHPDGSTARITPRVLFGEKFFVFGSSPPAAVRAWAAYSATGARLAAGAVP